MKCCILRKVVYKLPESSSLRWGIVLCQNGGLTLLYVPRCDDQGSHRIAICTENLHERLFEDVATSQFLLDDDQLCSVGNNLLALGERIEETKLKDLLEDL
jgi:hypothetical protein